MHVKLDHRPVVFVLDLVVVVDRFPWRHLSESTTPWKVKPA